MSFFFILFKINLLLGACYLLYRLFLSRLTFFGLNRVFLAGSVLVAALSPLLSFTISHPEAVPLTIQPFLAIPATAIAPQDKGIEWTLIVQTIYWAGIFFLAALFLFRLVSLFFLFRNSKQIFYHGHKIRMLKGTSSPFSFFRTIFLNPELYSEEELALIMEHEQAHIDQWHSVDVLLGTLCRICCWFNPLAWMLDKAIRKNLEFLADSKVLQQGTERRYYQYSLLHTATGNPVKGLNSYFNFTHLKIRIHMMNKERSAPAQLLHYAMATGILSALLLTVSLSYGQQKKKSTTATQKHTDTAQQTTQEPLIIVNKKPMGKKSLRGIDPKDVNSVRVIADKEAAVAQYGPDAANGVVAIEMKNPEQMPEAPSSVTTVETPSSATVTKVPSGNAPLVVVDGKVWEQSLTAINPKQVASMSVVKEGPQKEKYGDAAKNGVIFITTK